MADPTTDLLSFFLLLISLGISLAIIVPLTGALVRFRANYNPKGLQLDAEGECSSYWTCGIVILWNAEASLSDRGTCLASAGRLLA